MPTPIPHRLILDWERSFARSLALAVIRPHQLGVWDVLIPIVFILNWMRSRQDRELLVQNYLFTKGFALDGARDMGITAGRRQTTRQTVLDRFIKKTDAIIQNDSQGIYADAIRQQQCREIELLLDHYARLLSAEGITYEALVRRAYPDGAAYAAFFDTLRDAEQRVADAASETLGPKANARILEKLRAGAERMRRNSVHQIFAPSQDMTPST